MYDFGELWDAAAYFSRVVPPVLLSSLQDGCLHLRSDNMVQIADVFMLQDHLYISPKFSKKSASKVCASPFANVVFSKRNYYRCDGMWDRLSYLYLYSSQRHYHGVIIPPPYHFPVVTSHGIHDSFSICFYKDSSVSSEAVFF